mgnify:CR=1 FL=1
MTETGGPHTMYDMTVDLPDSLRGSFGCPVPGLEHKLVDPDSGLELAGMSDRSASEKSAGEAGEICVRGYSLMQGLYKQQRDSVFDEAGWYHTGDGGSFNEQGHLFFEGRLGDRKSTRLNSSHALISYAVFCLKKKNKQTTNIIYY